MPQMDFYFNDSERRELFEYLKIKGGRFVPDILFNSEEYLSILNYEEFEHYQGLETTHFFLIDDNYFHQPLVMSKNKFIPGAKYYVNQRKGGPYIDFSFYRGYARDAIVPYKPSSIDVYSKFINYNSYNEYDATDELKKYYNDIITFIKRKCKIIKMENKRYWISNKVLEEIAW